MPSPKRVPNPSPTLDKNLASMGPGILSSVGVGVWGKAPETFPDSNTTLDTFQSAMKGPNGPCSRASESQKYLYFLFSPLSTLHRLCLLSLSLSLSAAAAAAAALPILGWLLQATRILNICRWLEDLLSTLEHDLSE